MCVHHTLRRSRHPLPVLALDDVVPDRSTGSFLHRDALGVRPLPERSLFVLSQAKGHCHRHDGIILIPDAAPTSCQSMRDACQLNVQQHATDLR